MRKHQMFQILMIASLSGFSATATSGPFDQGKTQFSLMVGAGTAFNQSYTVIGAGIDYFVMDGLQLGVDAQVWSGGDRSIKKISPQARYVLDFGSPIQPYVGVFYRKTYIDNFEDLESVGGRAGVYLQSNGSYTVSAGYVFESYKNCNNTSFSDCTDSYPEVTLSISI